MKLTQRQKDTLEGILIHSEHLNSDDIQFLKDNEFIYTEYSDYGYKLSDKGMEYLS